MLGYPSANRTLLLQERTGHLGAQPVETHLNPNCFSSSLFFCFDRHFELSRGLPLYTCFQTPVLGSPFPVPRSPFPVPGISNIRQSHSLFSYCQRKVLLNIFERSRFIVIIINFKTYPN